MQERFRTPRAAESRGAHPVRWRTTWNVVLVSLCCILGADVVMAQSSAPKPQSTPRQTFEDSLRQEIRLRQQRVEQLRERVRTGGDEDIAEALDGLQSVIAELETELADIQVRVDENAILFSNTDGDLRIEIPEDIGQRVSEGLSAITASIMAELPDSVDVQREIRRLTETAETWDWSMFGEEDEPEPRKIVGNDLFSTGKPILVAPDERVTGNVVALFSEATILGEVDGSVTVVGADLILGEDALAHDEVTVLFGSMLRDDNAQIDGNVNVINSDVLGEDWNLYLTGPAAIVAKLTGLLVLAILLLVTLVVVPGDRVAAVDATLNAQGARSLVTGSFWFVLGHLLLLIVFVVLVATVIGIPLALLLALGYLAVGLLSVGVVTRTLGRRICGRPCTNATILPLLIGLLLVSIPGFVGAALRTWLPGGGVLADLLLVLGLAIHVLVYALGSGAVLISRFGGRSPSVE